MIRRGQKKAKGVWDERKWEQWKDAVEIPSLRLMVKNGAIEKEVEIALDTELVGKTDEEMKPRLKGIVTIEGLHFRLYATLTPLKK